MSISNVTVANVEPAVVEGVTRTVCRADSKTMGRSVEIRIYIMHNKTIEVIDSLL